METICLVTTYRVPWAATRALLTTVLSEAEFETLRLPLRPIFHTDPPDDATLSDLQTTENQLRFYTGHRCLRELRRVGWTLAKKYPRGIRLEVHGEPTAADLDFFRLLSVYLPLEVSCDFSLVPSGPSHAEDLLAFSDLQRVNSGLKNREDWSWFHLRLSKYLNCGDSWTATWLAEQALASHTSIPSNVGDTLGLAFG